MTRATFLAAALLVAAVPSASLADVITTSYDDAMQPNVPAANWQYLWNSTGAIGNPANYAALVSHNSPFFFYTWDGGPPASSDAPAGAVWAGRTGTLAGGGHPGLGSNNAGSGGIERFMIARYTLPADGFVQVLNGLLTNVDASSDGLHLMGFVGNNPIPIFDAVTAAGMGGTANSVAFGSNLGFLSTGTAIYVAVGSRQLTQADTFELDYTITIVPEPSSLMLTGLVSVGGLLRVTRRRRI